LLGAGVLSVFSPLNDEGATGDHAVNVDDRRLSLTTELLLLSSRQVSLTSVTLYFISCVIAPAPFLFSGERLGRM